MKKIERIINILEFNKILKKISVYAATESAREIITQIKPLKSLGIINYELDLVQEAIYIEKNTKIQKSFSFDDIRYILDKAKISSLLTMAEILKVSKFINISLTTKSSLINVCDEFTENIKSLLENISNQKNLLSEISRCIISETEMHDRASAKLYQIRKDIRGKSDQIKKQINKFVTSKKYSDCLQDAIVTIRNNRYVLPVKSEYKNFIPGLMHDRSASGQTLFIEPISIVELNNDLKALQIDEEREMQKIIHLLVIEIASSAMSLENDYDLMVQLDTIFAKANYAIDNKSIRPSLNNKGIIQIVKGKHPLIDANKVVPISISLGKNYNILIVTGPNTGGKTVTIKLVGLFVIMAMSALFINAEVANISIFDNIFCDIGDEQSIEQNLSTFSSHISNIKYIVDNITDKSLVLLDELGAGTDPREGSALALAIVDYLDQIKSKSLITTHYNELREYALVKPNLKNASMEFNINTYEPTFNLLIGSPGFSNALFIASKLGLKQEIIDSATKKMDKLDVKTEDILKSIENIRINVIKKQDESDEILQINKKKQKEIEDELNKIKNIKDRLQKQANDFKSEYIKDKLMEVDQIIDQIKKLAKTPNAQNLFKARDLKSELSRIDDSSKIKTINVDVNDKSKNSSLIDVNANVFVNSLNQKGVVIGILNNGTYQIKLGNITGVFNFSDLTPLIDECVKNKQIPSNNIKYSTNLSGRVIPQELNLMGLTGNEAEIVLKQYLSDVYVARYSSVKIIHGYGTGKLRSVVDKVLSSSKIIKSYREGKFGEGGSGTTIVSF